MQKNLQIVKSVSFCCLEYQLVACAMLNPDRYIINIPSSDEEDDDDDDAIKILEFRKETQHLLNHPQSKETPKIVKKLNDVECPICFDQVENATVTSCGHIFCLDCIQQSISSSSARGQTRGKKGTGLCPLCREKVTFKDTTLLRLKVGPKIQAPNYNKVDEKDSKEDSDSDIDNNDKIND